MSTKGYDIFHFKPDTVDEMHCKVCGTICLVERNVTGPTGFAEAMAKRSHLHDVFNCPNSGIPWHEQALELVLEIEKTPSKRLAELMRLDLEEILKPHGCL